MAENGHRPAIDVVFRSVARSWGERGIGVVLSGSGDDGTAGLAALRECGGTAVVQDPAEALFSAMPRSALEHVDVNHCVLLRDMAPLLVELSNAPMTGGAVPRAVEGGAEDPAADSPGPLPVAGASGLTCPDCGGALWEIHEDEILRFRCRIGHTFSPESLFDQQSAALESALWGAVRALESALWGAVRALEERAALARGMAQRFRARGHEPVAVRFDERARAAEDRAGLIRRALLSGSESDPNPLEMGLSDHGLSPDAGIPGAAAGAGPLQHLLGFRTCVQKGRPASPGAREEAAPCRTCTPASRPLSAVGRVGWWLWRRRPAVWRRSPRCSGDSHVTSRPPSWCSSTWRLGFPATSSSSSQG